MAPRSHLVLPAIAAMALVLLTGCRATPEEGPTDPPSSSPTSEPSPSETAEAPSSTPIELGCDELVSPDTMYAFNPNFGLVDWEPEAGTDAATAVSLQGIACRWVNGTSADTIDVSVADLAEEQVESLKNQAVTVSTMVPTYGEEAYFEVEDGIGTAIVFDRGYWLVARSGYFFEPGDATEIVEAALSALP